MGKRIVGAIVAAAAAVSFGVVTSSAADAAPIDGAACRALLLREER